MNFCKSLSYQLERYTNQKIRCINRKEGSTAFFDKYPKVLK